MLTKLDDTLFHQAPTTFDHAVTSDHRFNDRYWFEAIQPGGATTLWCGLGLYKNTNTIDGYCLVARDGIQHNLRVSRALRPQFDPRVGPLSIEVLEGLRSLRLRVEPGEQPVSFDVVWTASFDPIEEHPWWRRLDGRVQADGCRFNQLGRVDGWLDLAGERIELENWFGARDHSWGVRPAMGGYEPVTRGPVDAPSHRRLWLAYSTAEHAGYVSLSTEGNVILETDGHIVFPAETGRPPRRVVAVDIDVEYRELSDSVATALGSHTPLFDDMVMTWVTDDGATWKADCDVVSQIVIRGAGYDRGYDDEDGLGKHRGQYHQEVDAYDISDFGGDVYLLPERTRFPHWHRDHLLNTVVNGASGQGHFTLWTGPRVQ